MRYSTIIIFAASLLTTAPAWADCTLTPNGTTILAPETRPEGTVIYNIDYGVFQGCDGTDWRLLNIDEAGGPDFLFADQTGVALSMLITSNIVQIQLAGTQSAAVSITGDGSPQYRICNDAGCASVDIDWTAEAELLEDNQYIQARLTSDATVNATNSATITVGSGSDQWDVTTVVTDPCAGSPSPGDVCADGSYYVGQVGGNNVYATTAASESSQGWNNGGSNWTVTGATSTTDGAGNTATLVALVDAGAPYPAAQYCDGLTNVHGNSDWYLPARDELNLFWNGGTPVADVNTSGSQYWSSTESTSAGAREQKFSDGVQGSVLKYGNLLVRCVRR